VTSTEQGIPARQESAELELLDLVESKRSSIMDDARPEAVARQHGLGKLTARERIAMLLDPGSFDEFGSLVEPRRDTEPLKDFVAPADGLIAGYGRIDGRPVGIVASDFTVHGGGFSSIGGLKVERIAQHCMRNGIPFLQLHDSGGHRIQESLDSRHSASGTGNWTHFSTQARMSGWVPMANAILGPGFAGPSNFSALADFTVMVRGLSTMGAAGPALVEVATGEKKSNQDLGGAEIQVDQNGVAELAAESEAEALASIRAFLGYLPSNASEAPPKTETDDPVDRQIPGLRTAVPANLRRAYDVRAVILPVLDEGSVFELKPTYARNIITAFGRIGGRAVGVIANQPKQMAGAITSDACEKAARFVSMCDAFGLPIISFIDTPGLLVGSMAERQQVILRSGRMVYEIGRATVPRISVALRKGYGLGYVVMGGGRDIGFDLALAWPTAHICGMQVEGAVNVAYRKQIAAAPDPEAERERLISMYSAQVGILQTPEGFGLDEVIDPADTRKVIGRALARMAPRVQRLMPPAVHGISPI
jgi:acetyl-CoA carboxylase carboxyltransferase component